MMHNYKNLVVLENKTETSVSEIIGVRNAKRVVLAFTTDRTAGSCIFTVQATIDRSVDENWVESVIMVSNTPHNVSQEEQRTLSATLTEDGTYLYALDLQFFNYDAIKVKLTENGTGTSSCGILVEY